MQINTNIASQNSRRQLGQTDEGLARTLQRLSSGLRINSAKDDAAGLAIAGRMTSQIRGMNQASRNANDGISMLQTADGALSNSADLLQRIRELAVQAANSTNSAADRQGIQAEISQALAELDRVAQATTFNGEHVFSSTSSTIGADANQQAVLDGLKGGWLENAEQIVQQYYGLTADGATLTIDLTGFTDGAGGTAAQVAGSTVDPVTGKIGTLKLQIDMADFVPANPPNGGNAPLYNDRIILHEMVHAIMDRTVNMASMASPAADQTWFIEGVAELIHGGDERLNATLNGVGMAGLMARAATFSSGAGTWGGTSDDYSAGYAAARYLHNQIKAAGHAGGMKDLLSWMAANSGSTLDQAIAANTTYADADMFLADFQNPGTGLTYVSGMNLANTDTGAIGGLDADGGAVKDAAGVIGDTGTYSDNPLVGFTEDWGIATGRTPTTIVGPRSFQIGANARDTLSVSTGMMGTQAMGIALIDVTTDASGAIGLVDKALNYVSNERGKLGAQMNRLDSVVTNLQTTAESLSAARSRIQDADYAAETATLVRSQILQQAATAMTAQANAIPQMVLKLLNF